MAYTDAADRSRREVRFVTQCEKCGTDIPPTETLCAACAAAAADRQQPTSVTGPPPVQPTPIDSEDATSRKRAIIYGVVAALVLVLAAVGVIWMVNRNTADAPANVVRQLLTAYADYDVVKMLDLSTHDTIPVGQTGQLVQAAANSKAAAGGKAAVRGVDILKVTKTGTDSAKVEVSAEWLATGGTYTRRIEVFEVIRRDGRWLVKLF